MYSFFLLSGSVLCVCVYLRVRAYVLVRAFECECFVRLLTSWEFVSF